MKQRLLIAALAIGMAAGAQAQTIVYSQDFEGNASDIEAEGWKFLDLHGVSDANGIYTSNATMQDIGIEGNAAGVASFTTQNTFPTHIPDVDMAIQSPPITIPSGQSYLTYRTGRIAAGGGTGTRYSVYLLTELDMMEIENNEDMVATLEGKMPHESSTISGESTVTSFSIDNFEGHEITLVFRLHDTPGNSVLLVDDVAVVEGSLSTQEVVADQFEVYPNPVQDFLIVNSNSWAGLESVIVSDINGRTVTSKQFSGGTAAQLDISWINSGMYFVTIVSDKGTATKKIIKQ